MTRRRCACVLKPGAAVNGDGGGLRWLLSLGHLHSGGDDRALARRADVAYRSCLFFRVCRLRTPQQRGAVDRPYIAACRALPRLTAFHLYNTPLLYQ